MSRHFLVCLVLFATVGFGAPACTPAPTESDSAQVILLGHAEIDVSKPEAGLHLREEGPGSFLGTYTDGDLVFGIAIKEGACKPVTGVIPEVCGEGGGEAGHEIDTMITDRDGVPIAVAIGGDDFVEPSWAENMALGELFAPDAARRAREFAALEDLERELPAQLTGRLDLDGLLNVLHGVDIDDVASREHDADPFDVAGLPEGAPPPAASYYHEIHEYKGACCGVAEHSATLTFVYDSSWTPLSYVKRGNHGRYHSEAGMSWYCSYTSGLRSNSSPYVTAYYSTDTYGSTPGGGCNTSYGLTSGKHVCNDDSHAEIKNVKANAYKTASVCSDSSLNAYADACSSI